MAAKHSLEMLLAVRIIEGIFEVHIPHFIFNAFLFEKISNFSYLF